MFAVNMPNKLPAFLTDRALPLALSLSKASLKTAPTVRDKKQEDAFCMLADAIATFTCMQAHIKAVNESTLDLVDETTAEAVLTLLATASVAAEVGLNHPVHQVQCVALIFVTEVAGRIIAGALNGRRIDGELNG